MTEHYRQYSTKQRAKRIELEYFKRLHPFRRWRLVLSIALPALAGLWLLAHAVRGDQRIYTSGPVSTGHAMFGNHCAQCHVPHAGSVRTAGAGPSGGGFFLKVTDQACESCHAGPVHHEAQVTTPACATCHVEHVGRAVLANLDDSLCTACHASLELKKGAQPRFEPRIAGFRSEHPEFAVNVRDGAAVRRVRLDRTAELKDGAQVKLNHQKHLKVGLKGLEELQKLRASASIVSKRDGLQLSCTFCHESDATRATMQPISYARHCGPACHPLDVDGRLPEAEAPHDKVPLVHAYLRTLFLEAFEDCQALRAQPPSADTDTRRKRCQNLELLPAAARAAGTPAEPPADAPRGGRLGRRGEDAEAPASAEPPAADAPRGGRLGRRGESGEDKPAESRVPAAPGVAWVAEQVQAAERLMYKQKCEFCHVMSGQPGQLPATVPTAIPVRWLPHSVFDHGAHRPVACAECHQAAKSTETTDVLLPSVKVCQECHHDRDGARARCVECHVYHDKSHERPLDGPYTVRQLAGGASRTAR